MTVPDQLDPETLDAAFVATDALLDKKGFDVVMLDVGDLLGITEAFVIVTGTSRPHAQALAEAVDAALSDQGRQPLRIEGKADAEWILLDYGDFVVHVFQSQPRDFYGLERLWGDAPRVVVPGAEASIGGILDRE